MLKSWSIQNFKAIVDSGNLKLAPVTVLAGRNSSGKSSLLQSILMISQTLSNRVLERPLITNGPTVSLGPSEDILNEQLRSRNLIVGFELAINEIDQNTTDMEVKSVKVVCNFVSANDIGTNTSSIEAAKVIVENILLETDAIVFSTAELDNDTRSVRDDEIYARLYAEHVTDIELKQNLSNVVSDYLRLVPYTSDQSSYIGEIRTTTSLQKPNDLYLFALSHFLPTRIIKRFEAQKRSEQQLKQALSVLFSINTFSNSMFMHELAHFPDVRTNFIDTPISNEGLLLINKVCQDYSIVHKFSGKSSKDLAYWFKSLTEVRIENKQVIGNKLQTIVLKNLMQTVLEIQNDGTHQKIEGLENIDDSVSSLNILSIIQSIEYITRFFVSKIRYLGPLRTDPQASQKYPPSSELDDVGSKGEYAAAVYDGNQNALIDWYNPSSQQVEQGMLRDALNSWAVYLGVANQIGIETAGQSGFSWQVVHKEGHKPLPLSAVGVGVSQILPILVMGLLSPKGSLLIIEQPELHLHPRVQAHLGDFFVGLSKCNKQCLIETHSENLVSQLRLHIVQSGGLENSDCMIYFVDQDEQGAAKFEEVEISKNGNILNWPDGFFDETMLQEDKITAASIKNRTKTAKNATKHAE